jgi:hypothetical protein
LDLPGGFLLKASEHSKFCFFLLETKKELYNNIFALKNIIPRKQARFTFFSNIEAKDHFAVTL